jgi:cobalt-zinc-cadmium efflux system protein
MHGHHHHHHGPADRLNANARALLLALGLILVFAVVEVVGGFLADSLALLADATHMLGDAGSLGIALLAVWMAARPPTPERTFGFHRAEILAALANGVALVAIAIWIFVEAVQRLADTPEPQGGIVIAIGVAGLVLNLVVAVVVGRGRDGSLNLDAAFRHVVADALGSVGVIVGGVIVLTTGWGQADPLIGMLIGLLVLASSWTVLRDSISILLETTPRDIDARDVGEAMARAEDVVDVHDLHIWTITSGFPALAAHVLCRQGADCHGVRRRLEQMLDEEFGIDHTTLQVDHAPGTETPVELGAPFRRRTPLRRR